MSQPLLGPLEAEVVATRPEGAFQHVSLTVPDPGGGRSPLSRPGQFVVVPPETGGGRVLPRTWWLAGAHGGPGHPRTLEVVLSPVDLLPGDRLRLTGPVGRGFTLPTEAVPAVVVGHEAAQGPARWLAALLAARGGPVHLVLSARDGDHHLDLVTARRTAAGVQLTTAAGVGEAVLAEATRHGAGVVYAVGPADVVRAAAAAARKAGVVSQVTAFDAGGAETCGVGLCGGCTVHLAGPAGEAVPARPCAVGPVVRGDLLLAEPGGTA